MNRAGGSSAVEQRTVKRLHAAILWSGVQISLPGFFVFALACPALSVYMPGRPGWLGTFCFLARLQSSVGRASGC